MTSQLRPMITCQECGQENAEGYNLCVRCGHAAPFIAPQSQPAQQVSSYAIKFLVEGEELALSLVPAQRAIMGRQAPFMLQLPDVDLTAYNAAEHGISRVHAVIDCSRTGLQITDLDSRNGTFVNGEKLHPYNAHVLRHGDTVRLGSMSLEVVVKVDRKVTVESAPVPAQRGIPVELQPKVTRLLNLTGQLNGNLMSPVPPQTPANNSSTLNKAS